MPEEISLRHLYSNTKKSIVNNRVLLRNLFILTLMICVVAYLKALIMPIYQADCILVSKHVKYNQINESIEMFNSIAKDTKLNQINPKIKEGVDKYKISKFFLSEVTDDNGTKGEDNKFMLYRFSFNFNSKTNNLKMQEFLNEMIDEIQNQSIKDRRLIIESETYAHGVEYMDSILHYATRAGESYTNKISSSNGQLMVMNDLYKGVGDLVGKKLVYEKELSLLNSKNIIFQSSPLLISRKLKYPYMIFIIGFGVYIAVVAIIGIVKLLFID